MPTFPIPVFVALVLLFACLRLCLSDRRLGPLAALLAICAAQSLIIALAQHYALPGMRHLQPITATLIPVAAWLAFQLTAVRRAAWADLAHALVPLGALLALLTAPRLLDLALPGAFLGYGAALLLRSLQGPDAQPRAVLSNGSIPSLIWLIIGLALVASALSDGLILAAQASGYGHLQPWIISLFSVGNLLVIGIVSLSSHLQTGAEDEAPQEAPGTEPDAEVWSRVTAYMAERRPYLDPDLTLARLARRLGVPAKVLSTTINRATDENVSRFVNKARVEAAQRALMGGESITNAMLSSGFNTKSNFNREFLRVAGESPSDWLRKQAPGAGQPRAVAPDAGQRGGLAR
ncbi:helix-turn-helix domain-containing protein [Vannielia litorea]|uniref:Transcriptional regulator, AraC family n=1 Tax=Vannielia litorea TaxID=1217970 RepID=A0A1N6H5D2_9RHOB|nr:AraC family transcriptional regulator [Vannielia litorea]SIO15028.1 transcriptional regulator, AraC family [Vannielia litorea]